MLDLRDEIFRAIRDCEVTAVIEAAETGIVCGIPEALAQAERLDLAATPHVSDGDPIGPGAPILTLQGSPKAIAIGEETLIGLISKASGVATATRRFVEAAGRIRIVGGAYKKVPPEIRAQIRHAVAVGGADGRLAEHPMVYLDKNHVGMLGGVRQALEAVRHLTAHQKVVQLGGDRDAIAAEARVAVDLGASTLVVDTGNPRDIEPVVETLKGQGCRDAVTVAFAGGVTLESLPLLAGLGVDAVCVGRGIVDAPLLDLRLTVRSVRRTRSLAANE